MDNQMFMEKDMMTDLLSSEKNITGAYNTYANECACPELKGDMVKLLGETHDVQHGLFCEMQKRGWYTTEPAEMTKINEVKQKYQAGQS